MAVGRRRYFRTFVVILALVLAGNFLFLKNRASSDDFPQFDSSVSRDHPIDHLVQDARRAHQQHQATADEEAPSLAEVARAYRARRGRHPPPGFDAWYTLAVSSKASINEYFFDQIYEDLEPFWGEMPHKLRSFAERWPHVLSVRNNTVRKHTQHDGAVWLDIWKSSIEGMPVLPDVDLAVSLSDEPHVMVPFANLTKYMAEADWERQVHNTIPVGDIRDEMVRYPEIAGDAPPEPSLMEEGLHNITSTTYWEHIVRACRPDDPVFSEQTPSLGLYTPPIYSTKYTAGTTQGYVSNFTTSKNLCHNPNLRTLHGHAIAPAHDFIYTELRPLITAAKLQGISNDIIFPNPVHMLTWGTYQIRNFYLPWRGKQNKAVWRGSASGGQHTASTWWGFHRPRFLHLTNATTVSLVESTFNQFKATTYSDLPGHDTPGFDYATNNIPFPHPSLFSLAAQTYHKLGTWTSSLVDTAFTEFTCAPFYKFSTVATECSYLEPHYQIGKPLSPEEIDTYKYLPDIDGHSSSDSYRGFLHSNSVPLKASLFVEWADARLRPWLHFVPMSNEFQEWFGILEYFMGYKATKTGGGAKGTEEKEEVSVPDHDEVGRWIGKQGAKWARKVLRIEDMQLYMYRVILEYARICADDRVHLGWVGDL